MRRKKVIRYLREDEEEMMLEPGGKISGGFVILLVFTVLIAKQCETSHSTTEAPKETHIKKILTPDQESRIG